MKQQLGSVPNLLVDHLVHELHGGHVRQRQIRGINHEDEICDLVVGGIGDVHHLGEVACTVAATHSTAVPIAVTLRKHGHGVPSSAGVRQASIPRGSLHSFTPSI